jgi:hypothetical protein
VHRLQLGEGFVTLATLFLFLGSLRLFACTLFLLQAALFG